MSAELRELFLQHLSRRPSEATFDTINEFERAQERWTDHLEKLQLEILEGQSTGDILTDYVCLHFSSRPKFLEAETYLRELQRRVSSCVGQEILIQEKQTGVEGCSDYGGRSTSYEYNTYKLARILEGIQARLEGKGFHTWMSLDIITEGYTCKSNDLDAFLHKRDLMFYPENLSLPIVPPDNSCLILVGQQEINPWRAKNPTNRGIYQNLSSALSKGLALKAST